MSEIVDKVAEALTPFFNAEHTLYGADTKDAARAAIEAMREPTQAMKDAGDEAVRNCWSLEPGEGLDENPPEIIWPAMIEAALQETRTK